MNFVSSSDNGDYYYYDYSNNDDDILFAMILFTLIYVLFIIKWNIIIGVNVWYLDLVRAQ